MKKSAARSSATATSTSTEQDPGSSELEFLRSVVRTRQQRSEGTSSASRNEHEVINGGKAMSTNVVVDHDTISREARSLQERAKQNSGRGHIRGFMESLTTSPVVFGTTTGNTATANGAGPGAYPVQPGGRVAHREDNSNAERRATVVIGQEEENLPSPLPPNGGGRSHEVDDGEELAVANLIEDEEEIVNLPQARGMDTNARHSRDKQTKRLKTYILLGVILMIVIIMVLLALLIRRDEDSSTDKMETTTPSVSPSLAPTTIEESYLTLLPDETVSAIQGDPASPQALAFQWLLEDMGYHHQGTGISNQRIRQRYALATLFYSTIGDEWVDNTNWLNHSIHECDWYTGSDFGMKETINMLYPGYLEEFESPGSICSPNDDGLLEHLWLDQNNLAGSLPPELYLLTTLLSLSISLNNNLQGPISSYIGRLTNLEGFIISDLQKAGTIPSQIGLLSRLRVTSFRNSNHQGTVPEEVWKMYNLSTLYLGFNPSLEGSIPTEIGRFSNLRWLGLDECDFFGTIPSEIGNLKKLKWITFERNRLSGKIPSELGLSDKMEIISLKENGLTGTLPTELGLLTGTTLLSVRDNLLTGPVPSEFGLLTNLTTTLVLRNNQLSGQIPSEFGLLSNLREFSLENNAFSGTIPTDLTQLVPNPTFHSLKLQGNPGLSGTIPSSLCDINGTCIPNAFDPCEEPYGLLFDCTRLLCGCDCSCETK